MTRSHMYKVNISAQNAASAILRAWEAGSAKHASTHMTFDGVHRELWSFRGRTRFLTGQMHFWHCESRVLSVDFDKDLITDHGFTGFSSTTSRYLGVWMTELRAAGIHQMVSLADDLQPFDWTRTTNNRLRGAGFHEEMWQRFRAGVPWVKRIDGAWWFHGPSFSSVLMQQYLKGRDDVLNDGVSWHWFTYDWDAEGRWSKRFIDDAAERRWHKRQAKRAA